MKTTAITILSAALVLALLSVVSGQSDMTSLKDEAFGRGRRPAAAFHHDEHNEKASISDCSTCHHSGKNGVIVPGESSEGTPCSECHAVKAKAGETPLMRAYHKECIGCHKQERKGPVACGECHPRTTG